MKPSFSISVTDSVTQALQGRKSSSKIDLLIRIKRIVQQFRVLSDEPIGSILVVLKFPHEPSGCAAVGAIKHVAFSVS